MKINSIKQQNFKGDMYSSVTKFVTKHPAACAALAGSSVIGQKVVMSAAEATVGPAMDIGVGHVITKVTNEKDNRTNQSSKTQAIRTAAQAIGGTIVGVIVRGACIAASTALLAKAGQKAGSKFADLMCNSGKIDPKNVYQFQENASKWGKSIGGAVAIGVMLFTNFIIDAPFINVINEKITKVVDKLSAKKSEKAVNNG